jgi:hypothetical protein
MTDIEMLELKWHIPESLTPLLCYWSPSEDDPFENWAVCVQDRGRWYGYQPHWEAGRGYEVDPPDYFSRSLRCKATAIAESDFETDRSLSSRRLPQAPPLTPTIPLKVDGCQRILLKEAVSNGWLPISTAPKDGSEVDLWHPKFGRVTGSHWDSDLEIWAHLQDGAAPTHWMNVPENPDVGS